MNSSICKNFLCPILALAVLFCPSCGRKNASAEEILYKICASLELPAGKTYLLEATEGEENYLSPDTAQGLYGSSSVKEDFPLIEDYAIYLSSSLPCEIAVFKCYSRSDTDSVSAMCLERADELAVLMKNTELNGISQSATVITDKKYVVMLLCEDTEKAREIALRALG